MPTPAVLEIIATKLGCSVDYLVHGISREDSARLKSGLTTAQELLKSGAREEARQRLIELLADPDIGQMPEIQREGEYSLALAAEACGDLDEAIHILVKLREQHLDSLSDDHRIGSALALCRCYRDHGETDLAIEVAEQEISAMIEKGWTDHLIELGATLMFAYYMRGDLLRAEQYAADLLGAAEALGTSRAIVATNWNAAILADVTGRHEEALARIERAWAIQSVSGEPRNRARLHTEYTSMRLRIRPDEAAACRDELLETEVELRNSAASILDLAYCQYLLGWAEVELGNAAKAVDYVLESIRLTGESSGEILAEAQVLLGRAYQMLGRIDDAVSAIDVATNILSKEPATRTTAEIWLMAAAVLQNVGDQEGSRLAYQRAMECGGI